MLVVFYLFKNNALAQDFSEKQIKQWSKEPVWVQMIDDPNTNYFETTAAFDAFWKNRELPVEEDQILGAPRAERGKVETAAEKRKRIRKERLMEKEEKEAALIRHQYAFAVKKYRHWKLLSEPYVQPNGKILSKEEQLQLHQQQR
ncbi:MAG: hypothetical protein IPP71_15560 [Bacteroidetes bacterium]|nr:hypothetical protein [Bacteroidota bacterium]